MNQVELKDALFTYKNMLQRNPFRANLIEGFKAKIEVVLSGNEDASLRI